jgi:hypothetical protein
MFGGRITVRLELSFSSSRGPAFGSHAAVFGSLVLAGALAIGCSGVAPGNLPFQTGSSTTGAGTGAVATSGASAGAGASGAATSTTSTTGTGAGAGSTTSSSGAGAGSTTSSSGAGTGAGGATTASSSGGTGGDPYDTPPTCSSMTTALPLNGASMKPGEACQSCHVLLGQATGQVFDVSGTVYLTAHEPNDCNGVNVSGANVVITDATGASTSLAVNSAGNFDHNDLFGLAAFKAPFHASVQYDGRTRRMLSPITSGDCNSCHTETGTMSAPGRIMLP